MEYNLEKEQIVEILENYGGTAELIENIENITNTYGVITDEEEYYEVVADSVSRVETIKLEAEMNNEKAEYSLKEIVKYVIIRKFQEKGIDDVDFKTK